MKWWEPFQRLRNVGVPQPDYARKGEFSQQKAVHPSEGKLQEIKTLLFQMIVELLVDPMNYLSEFGHHLLNPGLTICVMVLNITQEFGETPVWPSFYSLKSIVASGIHIDLLRQAIKFRSQQDNDKRRCKVIDSLNITTCRMTHGPNEQDSFQQLLYPLVAKDW